MIKRSSLAALLGAATLLSAATSQATVVDLTTSDSGTINGAYFTKNYQQPAGTGVIDPFLTIQNTGTEQGYNSAAQPFDTKRAPQWNHEIMFKDLSITTIGGVQYYGFAIDINEPNNANSTISLTAFQVYTSATIQNSTSTDANGNFNGSLGTLRYTLGGNSVFYDDKNHGSGQADISIFIPVANFAGAQPNDYVYLYERFGNADPTTTAQGGFEETYLIQGITPVPEMSALFPIVGLLVAVGSTRVLRRRQMAKSSH